MVVRMSPKKNARQLGPLNQATDCIQQLNINGTIMFIPDDTNPNIVFRANIIYGHTGNIIIGSSTAPLDPKYSVTIELCGTVKSPYLAIDNSVEQINKGIMLTNNVSLFGSPRQVWLGRLSATALIGSPSISVKPCLSLKAGDQIAVGPGDFGSRTNLSSDSAIQSFVYTVTSATCSGGLMAILVQNNTVADHIVPMGSFQSGVLNALNANLKFAPEVAVLSRNIIIQPYN